MIQKSKKFSFPRKLFDKPRIVGENKLVKKYGLKNKREIWKSEAKVKYFRDRAKSLITASSEDQKIFFDKLNQIGLEVETIADVLALSYEDLLKRRLATVLMKKKFANTPKHARQMIVHKKVEVNGRIMNVPGYIVKVEEEGSIKLKQKEVEKVENPKQETEKKESNGGEIKEIEQELKKEDKTSEKIEEEMKDVEKDVKKMEKEIKEGGNKIK